MGSTSHTPTFLCQWHTLDGPIEKWIDEQHILDKNNLTYEHNLALANTFLRDKSNKDKLHQYPNNFHVPQTRDPCFVRPPIKPPHLTLITQEFNPNKDILASQPTIEVEQEKARIFDHTRTYISTIFLEQLKWLWERHMENQTNPLVATLQLPPQDFATKIAWLLNIYIVVLPRKKNQKHTTNRSTPKHTPNNHNIPNNHLPTHPLRLLVTPHMPTSTEKIQLATY